MQKRTMLILTFAALLLIAPACGKKEAEVPEGVDEPAPPMGEGAPALPAAAGPCDNILFPLSDGNQWVYAATSTGGNGDQTTSDYSWSVSEGDADSVTLATLFYDSGTVVSANVQCVNGAVENFPLTVSNIVSGEMEGEIEYTHVSGKYMPSLQELEAGNWQNTWQTVINASGTISADSESQGMTIVLEDSPITMDWQILEKDVSVSVPAGEFSNAVRVNQKMKFEISSFSLSSDMPVNISTTMTFDSDYWFVPNLGLVKTQVNSANVDLFGSNFPVEMTGGSVLKSSNLLN